MNAFKKVLQLAVPHKVWRALASELLPEEYRRPSQPLRSTAEVVSNILGRQFTNVIDVGARWGAEDAWWGLHPLARYIGFDADTEECARLNGLADAKTQIFVPKALGSSHREATLYLTSSAGNSSLLKPIRELGERYPDLAGTLDVVKEIPVTLTPLDAWAQHEKLEKLAFLKLDTQGTELDILRGAKDVLARCLGVEVEVEFSPIYHEQPLFSDVDTFLRGLGFTLWRLTDRCHYAEDRVAGVHREELTYYGGHTTRSFQGSGRLFFGNAIYLRDPFLVQETNDLLTLASLMSALGDLAAARACLTRISDQAGPGLTSADLNLLKGHFQDLCSASLAFGKTTYPRVHEKIGDFARKASTRSES